MAVKDEVQFVHELADLITLAVAHTRALQDPPLCDCSPRLARSSEFRCEMEAYSEALVGVIREAFDMLRVREVSYGGPHREAVH